MRQSKYSNLCLQTFGRFFSKYEKDDLEEKNLLFVKANIPMSYEEYYSMATMSTILSFIISLIFFIILPRGVFPRVRVDLLLNLGWTKLIGLCFINIFIALGLLYAGVLGPGGLQ